MSNFKSIDQIAYYKPIAKLGMEELAARQRIIEPSGGVLFARNANGEEKIKARQLVLDLFQPEVWPGHLRLLTMPGINWRFERLLLGAREQGWFYASNPRRTNFTAVENDRSIFFAAAAQMPGVHTPNATVKHTKQHRSLDFAEIGVKTKYAALFFANVDDLMKQDGWDTGWDAAWLDYTGPLTIERLTIIRNFQQRFVRSILVVTSLKARWNSAAMKAIDLAGDHSRWLRQYLEGDVLHDVDYMDTSPMNQFAVRKDRWKSALV